MEINRLTLIPCIFWYVEKMHPNLDEAFGMRPISFVHLQDFPCMKVLCCMKSQSLLFNILKSLQIFTKSMSHTTIIWNLLYIF
jgi:hypothetical protein